MLVQVWVGNAGATPNLSGLFGVCFLQNLTTGKTSSIYKPRGTQAVSGNEAEWIMERSQLTDAAGVLYYGDLADYGSFQISDAYARRTSKKYVGYQADSHRQISMTSDGSSAGTLLSDVAPLSPQAMQFTWRAFS